MSAFESWLLSCLLNSLWQIPLLFLAGWIAARALRPAGPAAEHRVWVATLLLQCALPFCSALRMNWLRDLLAWPPFSWLTTSSAPGIAHVSVIAGPGVAAAAFHVGSPLLDAIAVLYLGFCGYDAARFLWRCAGLRSLRRDAEELTLTGEAAQCWKQYEARFAIREVSLAASSRVFGPVTMGASRKLVLLPANMLAGLSPAEMQTAIAHEFAHLRRRDFLKNLFYELLSIPVSYHPILWLTRHRVTETREMVCDHMAAALAGRTQYARSLLRLASLFIQGTPAPTPHTIGIFDAGSFERRIMRLARKPSELRGLQRFAIIAACAALGIATCASALTLRMNVDASAPADHHAPSSGPVHVASGVMAGQRIGGPMPIYPPAAKKAKIQGKVVLDVLIGKDGTVKHLAVESGPAELRDSALTAVRQWIYKPFLLNGDPVDVETTINVIYSLGK